MGREMQAEDSLLVSEAMERGSTGHGMRYFPQSRLEDLHIRDQDGVVQIQCHHSRAPA